VEERPISKPELDRMRKILDELAREASEQNAPGGRKKKGDKR